MVQFYLNKKTDSQTIQIKIRMEKQIVIIGAGVAGIAAATKLISSGFRNVLIFEGQNRIGGRIHTIPFGASVLDMGAQW